VGGTGQGGGGRGSPESRVDGEGGVEAASESGGRRKCRRGPVARRGKREDDAGLQ
jgi:hypothetical protein